MPESIGAGAWFTRLTPPGRKYRRSPPPAPWPVSVRSPRRRSATASFNGADYVGAGGRFGIGTDSNIQIDAAAELRQLEYGQRLLQRARNVLAAHEGQSTGRCLLEAALAGGAQALQHPIGAIRVGLRADIVLLDADHPDLVSRHGDQWLDAWIFVAGRAAVSSVLIGGDPMVQAGRHRLHPAIEARYRQVIATLAAL